ncbi:hypothetical protein FVF58_12495 [Paraburkholderia panacisoli]|uniref:Uncharacterized protein n=1 Tax=Paraburkholderia panacisoli TaxID=2603818 RepID=A0A5B0H9Q1_9BURK|nr:hypothetical protein [Paraburkholderia panacisoli]KAA1011939.1 hypothetical protein FVF58_12495 [Paraburkholderia panacisoli]
MLDDEHTGRRNLGLPTIEVTCARVKPGLALRVLKCDVSLAAKRCGAGGRNRLRIGRPDWTQGGKTPQA